MRRRNPVDANALSMAPEDVAERVRSYQRDPTCFLTRRQIERDLAVFFSAQNGPGKAHGGERPKGAQNEEKKSG